MSNEQTELWREGVLEAMREKPREIDRLIRLTKEQLERTPEERAWLDNVLRYLEEEKEKQSVTEAEWVYKTGRA